MARRSKDIFSIATMMTILCVNCMVRVNAEEDAQDKIKSPLQIAALASRAKDTAAGKSFFRWW